jgi:hypothetical protein
MACQQLNGSSLVREAHAEDVGQEHPGLVGMVGARVGDPRSVSIAIRDRSNSGYWNTPHNVVVLSCGATRAVN